MDTNTCGNIMKALGGSQGTATGNDNNGKLTLEQQSQNYNTFSELMGQGVSLPDLLKRIDDLEKQALQYALTPRGAYRIKRMVRAMKRMDDPAEGESETPAVNRFLVKEQSVSLGGTRYYHHQKDI